MKIGFQITRAPEPLIDREQGFQTRVFRTVPYLGQGPRIFTE